MTHAATMPQPRAEAPLRTFHLLRYFSITSGIAVLLATIAFSWTSYQRDLAEQLEMTETRNVMLAQTYANTIWPQFESHLSRQFDSAKQIVEAPETRRLHDVLSLMSQRVPVAKIKIYNPRGTAIYSSERDEMGENKSGNSLFRLALAGKASSELTRRGAMSASEAEVEDLDVISTYIPIIRSGGQVDAVFELYSDVTESMSRINRATLRVVAELVLIFAVLYSVLLMIVRHADEILQRQYRELKEQEERIRAKNRDLEHEIVARREVEAILSRSEAAAAEANRAKSEFLSNMSHELRTPMNAILGFAQLLGSEPDSPLSATQKTFIEQILKAGRHLLELINEVLDLARIEAGKMTLSVEPVSLNGVLGECLPLIQNMARDKSIRLTLPDATAEFWVMADHVRLKQALLNLLSNAIKYNRADGSVSVAVTSVTRRVRISVIDTGPGIPESKQGELFQPFSRLGLNPADVEGTGIGLALTRKLVDAMGGGIGFVSASGSGSTFWIELPAAAEFAHAAAPARVSQEVHSGARIAARSILYIEDNPANVMLMEQVAKRVPARFLTAHNAEIGIALAAAGQPDLIIMDINLPQMSGYEALARLRRQPETTLIPVMALTANAMAKDIERGRAAGFVRYETKPIQVEEIIGTIRELLDGKT